MRGLIVLAGAWALVLRPETLFVGLADNGVMTIEWVPAADLKSV